MHSTEQTKQNELWECHSGLAKKIVEQFIKVDNTLNILINGSLLWGGRNAITSNSDIDIDIVFDSLLPAYTLLGSEFTLFRNNLQELILRGAADYGSFKSIIEGKNVGLHFIPLYFFEKVCGMNFVDTKATTCAKEYRLHPKDKEPLYTQRNFNGTQIPFMAAVSKMPNGQITHTPIAIIHRGRYYNGLLVDKYLTYPLVYSKNTDIFTLLYSLKKNLIQRMYYERDKFNLKNIRLSNLPYARDRIPSSNLDLLDWEAHRISCLENFM